MKNIMENETGENNQAPQELNFTATLEVISSCASAGLPPASKEQITLAVDEELNIIRSLSLGDYRYAAIKLNDRYPKGYAGLERYLNSKVLPSNVRVVYRDKTKWSFTEVDASGPVYVVWNPEVIRAHTGFVAKTYEQLRRLEEKTAHRWSTIIDSPSGDLLARLHGDPVEIMVHRLD